ncbi:hypothetical protein CHELA1G2_11095 [Hyphomicrobiales bacterium]|nr:hypothetical protein CHELA1G2_11095 [Hyphomicrobiales bacterium]
MAGTSPAIPAEFHQFDETGIGFGLSAAVPGLREDSVQYSEDAVVTRLRDVEPQEAGRRL